MKKQVLILLLAAVSVTSTDLFSMRRKGRKHYCRHCCCAKRKRIQALKAKAALIKKTAPKKVVAPVAPRKKILGIKVLPTHVKVTPQKVAPTIKRPPQRNYVRPALRPNPDARNFISRI